LKTLYADSQHLHQVDSNHGDHMTAIAIDDKDLTFERALRILNDPKRKPSEEEFSRIVKKFGGLPYHPFLLQPPFQPFPALFPDEE